MKNENALSAEYRLRFAGHAAYRDRVWQILTRDYFQRLVSPEGSVLELGSGWGEFIRNIRAAKKFAMDLNPDAQERAGAGVEFFLQDCSQTWAVPADSLDVIFTSNFFEHLPDKAALGRTIDHAMRCLKPGGTLICMGPNIRFLSELYWDFWDHHIALSDRSLVEAMSLAGFEIASCVPRFLPFSMSLGFQPPTVFLRMYLRVPWAWRFFGKQFLIVARKPR